MWKKTRLVIQHSFRYYAGNKCFLVLPDGQGQDFGQITESSTSNYRVYKKKRNLGIS
jgi:hypothetical protein